MANKTTTSPKHKRPGKDTKTREITYSVEALSSIAFHVTVFENGWDIAQAIVPAEHIQQKKDFEEIVMNLVKLADNEK
ncbi:MAG: hypothetical protein K9I29_05000 [Bacteroidales bacterium]|nr:hypothetical protein [Bacteroidales bacterium]MCF8327631.1 hypothetical protein [Bacteroidales bacterium]